MSQQQIDKDTLLAYVDGELEAKQEATLDAILAITPELRKEVMTLQRLQNHLRATLTVADYLPLSRVCDVSIGTPQTDWTRRVWLVGLIVSFLIITTIIGVLPVPSATLVGTLTTSPTPDQIVFATLRDPVADGGCGRLGVYLWTDTSTHPRHLADGCNPVLSPDGRMVAYIRASQLWVTDITTGGERIMSGDGIVDGKITPSWSANSHRIAFEMEHQGQADIYIVDTDGDRLMRLTNSAAVMGDWAAFAPIWSPDGQRLAFIGSSNRPGPEEDWGIYVIHIDGNELARVTDYPTQEGPIAWSPDGTQLLFWATHDDGHTNVYSMKADGSQVRQVTHGSYDSRASWSPDGSQIALVSTEDGQIYIVDLESRTTKQITTDISNGFNPIWSNDGQSIFFGAFTDDSWTSGIYQVRPDDKQVIPLITTTKMLQWTQR